MNVLLCNERFLFRFGVDRALLMLGIGLVERGHRVAVMANRFDRTVVESFASQVITVPQGGGSYAELNAFTDRWLREQWDALFDEARTPDVALIGGWPFFEAIATLERHGCATVFMDCGAVPEEGLADGALTVQRKLRSLRRQSLPSLAAIAPISRFIARTQSELQSGDVEVIPILLGADHMERRVWDRHALGRVRANAFSARCVSTPERPLIVNLGRWEPGCYKNSEAVYDFVDRLRPLTANFSVAILAEPDTVIPERCRDHVVAIGHPDDSELEALMQAAALGISVSQWEGFNLPLVEMQWLGRPVLAFDVAAHPEVILHPWFLCRDVAQMADKAADVLMSRVPLGDEIEAARARFREAFTWRRATGEYERLLLALVARRTTTLPRVLIDVSNASRDGANSGVVRVTRRLARELQRFGVPLFVIWNAEHGNYVFPTEREYALLSAFNGPRIGADLPRSPQAGPRRLVESASNGNGRPSWLFLTEIILEANGKDIRRFAAARGLRLQAIFYDAIPVLRPDLVKDDAIRDNHAAYMSALAKCDLVTPISEFSATCLRDFWRQRGIAPTRVHAIPLPGEFGGAPRERVVAAQADGAANVLCVSTLEPRKNHARLLAAFGLLATRRPDLRWTLTLIGNRYAGGDRIVEQVTRACASDARMRWLGIVDDATLNQAYRDCAFTIYASEIEGFGLPILESLWHGKPCICHNAGVMAEIAAGGGCLEVDMASAEAIAGAIETLASDASLYGKLATEACARPIKTWSDYAMEIVDAINAMPEPASSRPEAASAVPPRRSATDAPINVSDLLYPACLTTDWQMNDSERLGMTAILHRIKPTCAIEIGTYKGGSLSLLSQYAKIVFSIDIDPSIPGKLSHLGNVSFLTGPSMRVLPALLNELDAAELPVEFVLIDGDHSAAGVTRDIEIMLDYVPKKPLMILLHDGFNPDCRRGMLEARWQRSPYVQWVDLDFIPGRLVEHGGGGDGEMWGGLALALLTPMPRTGSLVVGATAKRAFDETMARHYA